MCKIRQLISLDSVNEARNQTNHLITSLVGTVTLPLGSITVNRIQPAQCSYYLSTVSSVDSSILVTIHSVFSSKIVLTPVKCNL